MAETSALPLVPESLIKVCESILVEEVDARYAFHTLEHTHQVVSEAANLADQEALSSEDRLLVETAALLHDIGYRDRVSGHEQKSVEMARELLPFHGYSLPQIDTITTLIESTARGNVPKNRLEGILKDANSSWLGLPLPQAEAWSERLYREFRVTGVVSDESEYIRLMLEWLRDHQYHGDSAKQKYDANRDRFRWSLERRAADLR